MNLKTKILNNLANLGILFAFILMMIIFSVLSPVFLRPENLINITRQVANVGIIAVGMTMVIVTANVDLSVGATVGFSAVFCAWMMLAGVHPVAAVAITILIGGLIGVINGFFVAHIGLPSYVVTLATQIGVRGVAYILTAGIALSGFTRGFRVIGQGHLGPIPIPVVIMIVAFVFGYLLLNRTRHGRYIYGVGGNEETVRLSGINPKKIKYMVFTINGLLSALSGVVLLSRVNSGNPNLGIGLELDVISAVVLGGVSIMGGKGKIQNVIIGVLFLGVLTNGLILLNVNEFVQMVIRSIVLIAAVSFDQITQRKNQSRLIVTED